MALDLGNVPTPDALETERYTRASAVYIHVVSAVSVIMYLTYLQENFKPVAHQSASVEVFDEEDVRVVHPPPSSLMLGMPKCQGT